MEITINNTRIIDFFKTNDTINVETFLLKNIDFYEYVLASINDNNTSQILPYILSQSNLINQLVEKQNKIEQNIEIVKDNKLALITEVDKLRNDNINNIKEIQNIILKNNIDYMSKTKEIINDMEKSIKSDNNYKEIINNFDKRLIENNNYLMTSTKETILSLNSSSNKDIQSLTKDIEIITNKSFKEIKEQIDIIKEKSPKEFENYFDKIKVELKNYSNEFVKNDNDIIKTIQNVISQELNTAKNNSDNNTKTQIDLLQHNISDIFKTINTTFNNISNSIDDTKSTINNVSNKLLNSSNKGKISENILEILLSKTFPTYIIERTSSESHAGDFMLKTNNKPDILIENKDYDKNVNTDEITKFIRDITENNVCGILVSQNSGISTKNNFEIDFKDNNILIYIHNCNYDMDKIQLALDIIYSLNDYISKNDNDENNFINEDTFNNIKDEYISFIKNRNDIISTLNLSIKNIKKMDLLSIKHVLEKHDNTLSTITSDTIICNECNKMFPTKQSLSAHKKMHFNERKRLEENITEV